MKPNAWFRPWGMRPGEMKVVRLLSLHRLLLHAGTLLVYVAVTTLALGHNPARTLPLAYVLGGLAMLAAGRLYARCARCWTRPQRAGGVLLAAAGAALGLAGALLAHPSVGMAVAGVVGFRLMGLLTQLSAWDAGAAADSGRQRRSLFGLTSATDLPARMLGGLGAVLAGVLMDNADYAVGVALLLAFGLYGLAGYLQRRALAGAPAPEPAPARAEAPAAGRALIRCLGLSALALTVVGVGVEYGFWRLLSARVPEPAALLRWAGGLLALLYGVCALGRRPAVRARLHRLGLRRAFGLLPLLALGGVALGAVVPSAGPGALAYATGLLLGLEALRRVVLEPAFELLLESLPPPLRRQGYAALKRSYEPLGLALGGVLLLGGNAGGWPAGGVLVWLGGFLLLALGLLRQTYRHYLRELEAALGLPTRLPAPADGPAAVSAALHALLHLHRAARPTLIRHAGHLLQHPHCQVRLRTLAMVGEQAGGTLLRHLALTDGNANVREQASCLAGRLAASPDLLDHADPAVRRGAIRGRLQVAPADVQARASLAAVVADDACQRTALDLLPWLEPAQQVACVVAGLRSPDPAVVRAATLAAPAIGPAGLVPALLALIRQREHRRAAAAALARLGEAALPGLRAALTLPGAEGPLRELAQVLTHLNSPASRQLLLDLAGGAHLGLRAAAVRALNGLPAAPAEAPLFLHLVEDEMRLAQHLVHHLAAADAELGAALSYEVQQGRRRLLGLLLQLYDRSRLLPVQRSLLHAPAELHPAALAPLEVLLPRPLYQALLALLETTPLSEKVLALDDLLGPLAEPEPIQTLIVRRGAAAFSVWTVAVALQQWHPTPGNVGYLLPHLQSPHPLLRESAQQVLRRLPLQRPAALDQLLLLSPTLPSPAAMPEPVTSSSVSLVARVRMLKQTALFGQAPESVLATLVPVMHEVSFRQEEEIFAEGALGTALFIIAEGEVGIFNHRQLLTIFGPGEFFGELALLDAAPRSATALALRPVRAFRIDQEDFYAATEDCADITRSIMRELCQRIRRQNEQPAPPVPVTRPRAARPIAQP
ncbi:cyclic nucleotide-binding domain-containing protein [Hymenobacter sp. NST-14]|uniref:cyclic nucleotide-binding domain-containing protein n=1 Tax=Hymenobacter piscis TaxID=2839984 RepID=UPI001C03305A|nr:cyclic nucleotide-binding domain-containing protein [Hymenobacter piscis]MBT9393224.1 cyclic nucleotide-binding domain-containing protein [Hymenobacter piscis]